MSQIKDLIIVWLPQIAAYTGNHTAWLQGRRSERLIWIRSLNPEMS
jgi:hypothetical protein